MRLKIGNLIKKFRAWLAKARAKINSRATEREAKRNQQNYRDLPQPTLTRLKKAIERLPTPQAYTTAIQSKLVEALAQWQEDGDAPNSLVILTSPIEPIQPILNEILVTWEERYPTLSKSLSWSARPQDYSTIRAKLQEKFELPKPSRSVQAREFKKERGDLVVIPDLSWCFLRCLDGLEGIEYLQDLVFRDRSRFWLVGCNDWAWQYLDCVCQTSAYFGETLSLPALKDIDLKQWLNPVSEPIDIDWDSDSDGQTNESDEWIAKSEKEWFEDLADISQGISTVATQIWLRSLRIAESKEEYECDRSEIEKNIAKIKLLKKPTLPDLPDLSKDDRYLLFSLCLHREMTIGDLALSLAEHESTIQGQVQVLWHSGLIWRRGAMLTINPAHYPKLKKDLDYNRFLVGDSD